MMGSIEEIYRLQKAILNRWYTGDNSWKRIRHRNQRQLRKAKRRAK